VSVVETGNFHAVDPGVVGTPSGAGSVGSAVSRVIARSSSAVSSSACAAPGIRASTATESSPIASSVSSDSSVHETLWQRRRTVSVAGKPGPSLGIAVYVVPASAVRSSGRAEIPGIPRISAVPRDPSAGFV
jgi:hypothetical protein